MRVAWRNFTGGELSDTLSARYDLSRFSTSVRCMENFLPNLHGDVARRPGMRCIAELEGPAVILPFIFNSDPEQNFILILSDKKLHVSDGHRLLDVEEPTPYAAKDLYALSHKQVGDVVYLAHPDYPLGKIVRFGSPEYYLWSWQSVAFNSSLSAPSKPSVRFEKGNRDDNAELGHTLRYKVVAVDANGRESLPSQPGAGNGKHPSDWVVGNHVVISWSAVSHATEYNVYREEAGYYGFIGVARGTSFVDNNYEADISDTPREDWNPFAGGNYPATVAFHQQRLVLGGTRKSPQSFYLSRSGDFENFRKSRPLMADDPVEYALASGSIDAVQWAESFGDLLIGTAGAEYKATGEGGVLSAKSVNITSQSYWGSAGLTPIIVGNSILHVQRHGAHVRDLFYSLEKDGYSGNDLSVMAPHLFEGHSLKQWDYQQSPGSRVWIVRDDGVLLCLTYMKEHEIAGFSRHITDGKVLSVAVINGDNEDAVFMVTERKGRYFLERLGKEFGRDDKLEDAFFVDCGVSRHFDQPVRQVDGLHHLEGREVSALLDGAPAEKLKVKNGVVTLPWPARHIQLGLPYCSKLSPFPLEADTQNGSTLGKCRAYGRCEIRLHRSLGGKYGSGPDTSTMFDIPFVPEKYGAACELFSGDVEINPAMGQDAEAALWLAQDQPLPFQIMAIVCDVNFGEQ